MDIAERIAQFENMCQADPDNDMAHFSLGGAYAQSGRHADAAQAYLSCIKANDAMSKARQLAAECLVKAGDEQQAGVVATEGYVECAKRGDLAPRNALAELLAELGMPLPELPIEVVEAQASAPTAAGDFVCTRTGQPGTRLGKPPFKGPIGRWIHANISAQTWQMWIGQGTKVINELRLDLSRDEDGATYDEHMREFLGIDESLYAELMREHETPAG
jgi:Fe-S cluster biosynthesis and repair protein YggX